MHGIAAPHVCICNSLVHCHNIHPVWCAGLQIVHHNAAAVCGEDLVGLGILVTRPLLYAGPHKHCKTTTKRNTKCQGTSSIMRQSFCCGLLLTGVCCVPGCTKVAAFTSMLRYAADCGAVPDKVPIAICAVVLKRQRVRCSASAPL
jgi:hypothetical protein